MAALSRLQLLTLIFNKITDCLLPGFKYDDILARIFNRVLKRKFSKVVVENGLTIEYHNTTKMTFQYLGPDLLCYCSLLVVHLLLS